MHIGMVHFSICVLDLCRCPVRRGHANLSMTSCGEVASKQVGEACHGLLAKWSARSW